LYEILDSQSLQLIFAEYLLVVAVPGVTPDRMDSTPLEPPKSTEEVPGSISKWAIST
jgi:hypothetical protein